MVYTKEQQLKKNKQKPLDLMDKSEVVRFDKVELKKRVEFIQGKEVCQVCEKSKDLDPPHHARFGWSRKDDRFLVCICRRCHYLLHNIGFSRVNKTREETEEIGWNNHKEYMNEQVPQ